jgi:hypothetical protein
MSDPQQQGLFNLVLIAHAEIRALREVMALLVSGRTSDTPVNAANWAAVEAECRRKHFEALNLPVEQFDGLLSQAVVAETFGEAGVSIDDAQSPPVSQSEN